MDAGVGSAEIAVELSQGGFDVYGVDVSHEMLERARANARAAHANIKLYDMSITALEFPDGYFDAVLCSETLEHIKELSDVDKAISEFKRVTKPGGWIFVTVPYMNKVKGTERYPHYQSYDKHSFDKHFFAHDIFEVSVDGRGVLWFGLGYKNTPEVSIIIPNYNHRAYILDAIGSAQGQTFIDTEIIVFDDGADDGALGVIEGVKLLALPENRGVSYAWDLLIRTARAPFLIVLSSDDMFYDYTVEVLHDVMVRDEDIVLAYGWMTGIDSDGNTTSVSRLRDFDYDTYMRGNYIGGAVMFRRVDSVGALGERVCSVDVEEGGCCDYGLWLKYADYAARNGKKLVRVQRPLYMYRTHESTSRKRIERSVFGQWKRYVLDKATRRRKA